MKSRRSQIQLNAEINLTNMIDVIFAILVVFMITAPLMSQGVKVDLPKAQAASMDEKKTVNITITAEREIILNSEIPTDELHFKNDFRSVWTGDEETVVIVNSDRKVPYGFVMKLVTEAQSEGAKKLGFLTDPSGAAKLYKKLKRKKG